ncbi:MAG TPA: patatin-like phospholipase family protein, partial [Thermoanaerobaculia bacterium]|nr:patatin-like phospholipase family protein [Thermoanaerobaculia bacterium]
MRRRIVDDAFTGAIKPLADVRLDNVYAAIHKRREEGKPRTALCISGGGIRSATFALGVIQGLSTANILDKFDYLSTVSGGGYIGSWLSSWIRRHRDGVTGVKEVLQRADTAVGETEPAITDNIVRADARDQRKPPERKLFPEPEPLRHLREYSNYLSPKLNLFSGDTWTLASLYVRNLVLNLLVLVPLLAVLLSFPRIFSVILEKTEGTHPESWAWASALLITYGFGYLGIKRPVIQGRKAKWTAATDGWFILNCIGSLTGAAVALAVFYARYKNHIDANAANPSAGADLLRSTSIIGAGILTLLGMTIVPWALYYFRYFKATAAERRTGITSKSHHTRKQVRELFAVLIAVATTVALVLLLANKVFDDPVRDVPTAATLAPIDRVAQVTSPQAQLYVCFAVPLMLLVFFLQATIFVGLSGHYNEDYDREWWGRAGAWLIASAIAIAILNGIAVFGPVAFYYAPAILGAIGGGAGIVAATLGFSDRTSASKKEEAGTAARATSIASVLAVPLFIAALLAAISLGTTWLTQQFHDANDPHFIDTGKYAQLAVLNATYARPEQTGAGLQRLATKSEPRVSQPALATIHHLQTVQYTTPMNVLVYLGTGFFAFLLSFRIGINKFSMASLYRNRIIRAYLGASRYNRDPDSFTGFDENDNVQMWELRSELLWSSSLHDPAKLVEEMRKDGDSVPRRLWNALDDATRKALENKVEATSIDSLILNVNALLMEGDLAATLKVETPKWVINGEKQFAYPLAIRNRATLDAHFSQWIAIMPPPADAPKEVPRPRGARPPMHVVNQALNLTTGENLAWQQRMASSFTSTPLHCGNLGLGYRSSREYGGEEGMSLGTAVTISGAAASPNMGYHSSPTMAFLLTFFNIRLGSWLGNPGPRGDRSYKEKHPRTSLVPLFAELTGSSNAKSPWVYLSDGGHFENLGLYEMVVRRCHDIVLSDGGADPECTFEDLGAAIRKIRIDFGIPIEIESISNMHPRSSNGQPVEGSYVLTASIRYDAVDVNAKPGHLTYIKPGLY